MKYTSINESTIRNLEKLITESIKEYKVPGVSLAIIEGKKGIFSKVFGVKHSVNNDPIVNNTVFEAASLTKPVVAYAALKLYERKILDLDIPLGKYLGYQYLPEDPMSQHITARHILSHSCGFPNWRGKDQLKVKFTPGEKFCYSGEGFVYLQKVIEHVTKQTLDEHIKENIFEPFEMDNSSLIWIKKYDKQASYPHDENGIAKEFYKALKPNAAWSLYTTPEDYGKFISKVIQNNNDNEHCLAHDTISQMIKEQVKVNEVISWGLGWGIENNDNSIWHWGDNGEFKAFTLFYPKEKIGIVIMTNGFNGLKVCRDIIYEAFAENYRAFEKYLNI